jgi:(1->4)-alpha-D-glucan 1-alpha-D-glucosylmutase
MVPDANEELLIYQTLLGAWPLNAKDIAGLAARVEQFLIKAAREAKLHTTWLRPDEEYEAALTGFAKRILRRSGDGFLGDFLAFQQKIAHYGFINALSQVVLKTVSPGVPDFYQGSEVWDLSLVDPDNRRPVDYSLRERMLESLEHVDIEEMLDGWQDGRVKLFATTRLLQLRKGFASFFASADYQPLEASGARKENAVAFARASGSQWLVVVTPRLVTQLATARALPLGEKAWNSSALRLPAGAPEGWTNVFTGDVVRSRRNRLPLAEVFARFPVAVLIGES